MAHVRRTSKCATNNKHFSNFFLSASLFPSLFCLFLLPSNPFSFSILTRPFPFTVDAVLSHADSVHSQHSSGLEWHFSGANHRRSYPDWEIMSASGQKKKDCSHAHGVLNNRFTSCIPKYSLLPYWSIYSLGTDKSRSYERILYNINKESTDE